MVPFRITFEISKRHRGRKGFPRAFEDEVLAATGSERALGMMRLTRSTGLGVAADEPFDTLQPKTKYKTK